MPSYEIGLRALRPPSLMLSRVASVDDTQRQVDNDQQAVSASNEGQWVQHLQSRQLIIRGLART